MTERFANTVGGAFLLAVALVMGVLAHGLPTSMQDQYAGPSFMPTVLSIALGLCAAALIVQAQTIPSSERLPGWAGAETAGAVRIVVIMAATAAYNLLMMPLGYFTVTLLYLLFLLRFLRVSWKATLAISIVTTAATFAMFDLWLRVLLPRGPLGI